MSQDGKYAYFQDYASNALFQFALTIPYDITTLTGTVVASVDLGVNQMMGGSWNATGTYYAARQWAYGPMYVWAASTPWMVNTFSGGAVTNPSSNTSYTVCVDVTGSFAFTGVSNNEPLQSFTGSWGSGWGGTPSTYSYGGASAVYCAFPSFGATRLFEISDNTYQVNQINMASAGNLSTGSNGSSCSFTGTVAQGNRNTMGVMIGRNNYWYMMAQRGPQSDRYVTWWKTGT
jgi:hypothetical protein